MGSYCGLVVGGSYVGISETDVFVVSSYCEIRFGVVVGRDILVVALCLVCLWSILVFL